MNGPEPSYVAQTVATALQEDVGSGDLTAQLIPADRIAAPRGSMKYSGSSTHAFA
jgi:nicotinate-nucleotide pyrophosphorylase